MLKENSQIKIHMYNSQNEEININQDIYILKSKDGQLGFENEDKKEFTTLSSFDSRVEFEDLSNNNIYYYSHKTNKIQQSEINLTKTYIKSHLITQVINADIHKSLLNSVPHQLIGDLAVIYAIDTSEANTYQSDVYGITNNKFEGLKMSLKMQDNKLYKLAVENTQQLFPAKIKILSDIVDLGEEAPEASECKVLETYVLSNDRDFYGANVLLYPDTINKIREFVKGDAFIVPSSVHEFLIFNTEGLSADILNRSIEIVNQTTEDPEEILSNNVYQYDYKSNVLFNTKDNSILFSQEAEEENDKEAEEILEYEEEIEEDIELSTLMKNTLFPSSGEDIMRDLEDIMCIAHTDKYAVYADQYERLKVIEDIEHIVEIGDLCMDETVLIPINEIEAVEQEKINAVFEEV